VVAVLDQVAARRRRKFLRCPIKSLGLLGVDCASMRDVILTHLHALRETTR
jgi:hypothetical protein